MRQEQLSPYVARAGAGVARSQCQTCRQSRRRQRRGGIAGRGRVQGIGLMSHPARGGNDRAAGLDIGTRVGLAKPREARHDSGIEGELGPVPERETARKTSMRRASATGTSTRMSASRTLRATLAPASRQARATACSNVRARVGFFFFLRAFLTASNGSTQVPVPKRPTL